MTVYPILPRGQADRWGFVSALGVTASRRSAGPFCKRPADM